MSPRTAWRLRTAPPGRTLLASCTSSTRSRGRFSFSIRPVETCRRCTARLLGLPRGLAGVAPAGLSVSAEHSWHSKPESVSVRRYPWFTRRCGGVAERSASDRGFAEGRYGASWRKAALATTQHSTCCVERRLRLYDDGDLQQVAHGSGNDEPALGHVEDVVAVQHRVLRAEYDLDALALSKSRVGRIGVQSPLRSGVSAFRSIWIALPCAAGVHSDGEMGGGGAAGGEPRRFSSRGKERSSSGCRLMTGWVC